jgi:tetratricopeptide (TPR) repeat protein
METPGAPRRRAAPASWLLGLACLGLAAWAAISWWSRPAGPLEVRWSDVTAEAGISFRHEAGARGEMLNPETFGPGAGWLDYDGDGKPDLLLVNGNALRGAPDPAAVSALYRNSGRGRFQDVTAEAGLQVPFYAMGFVSGDIDNDGDQDLLIYGLHRSVLFKNDGRGRFRDVTSESGLLSMRGWVCAALFFDYDRDGKLDLFVGNYVTWAPEREEGVDCTFGSPKKKYCPVALFPPSAPQLFHGRGDGGFDEVTEAALLSRLKGKTLGAAVEDYDGDGLPDIFVANDSVPNFLLHNRGDGTFEERGVPSGFATDANGSALAGMGIDTAWASGGRLLVAVGNFAGEPTTVHLQEGTDYFLERSMVLGVGRSTLDRVTFGLLLYDHDLDGNLDLALANGHVFDVEETTHVPYRQRCQFFWGRGPQGFEEARPADPAHFLNRPILGRALAFADYDGDGDLDLVVTENQGQAFLLRNDLAGPKRYVRLELRGTRSNRDALGAVATLQVSGPRGKESRRRTRKASSSYLSQSERQITFGLGPQDAVLGLEVAWPSGLLESFAPVPLNQEVLLVEGSGTIAVSKPPPSSTVGSVGTPAKREAGRAAASNSVIVRQKGIELLEQGSLEDALKLFHEAARLDPQDFVAHRFGLITLFRAGRHEEVESKAIEIARLFPDAHLLMTQFALVLLQSGYPELAEKMFHQTARLDPRRPDVWTALGNLAFDRKDYDRALEHYGKVIELKPDSIEALANIGKVQTIRKDFAKALPYLEKAVSLRPDYASALSTLGAIKIEEGNFELAEEYLTRALKTSTSRETLLTIHGNLGILYLKRRDRQRAIESFEKVLELEPGDRQARAALERLRG